MQTKDFHYELPSHLIAQSPMEKRDMSRLMVLDRTKRTIENKFFNDITQFLNRGDCLVLNDTRVIPARLIGEKASTGGKIEFVLLNKIDNDKWSTLVKPGRRANEGDVFSFGNDELTAEILSRTEEGGRIVRFSYQGIFEEILDRLGQMPLPPYIKVRLEDKERYQTVYSKESGSAAAPTAGLHFTDSLLKEIKDMGVHILYVTLHIGLGTFRPVKAREIEKHKMHSEFYKISEATAEVINKAKEKGNKVLTVGTTSTRLLETVADKQGIINAGSGWTDIFIYPGYRFKIVDGIVTNFHLPESTLIMMISAFGGRDYILQAYKKAVEQEYRFYSLGDAMLIY